MKILYLDIDGCAVKADINKYTSQIELFDGDSIKDFEYIKKCIQFMLEHAVKNEANQAGISFIKRVYDFVTDMFEMSKEYRDCFLEFDNLVSFEDKIEYIENYKKNPVLTSNNQEIPNYMNYIIVALKYAKTLIEREYARVKREGGSLNLPFKTINEDNDIIHYSEKDDSLTRADSALKRMEIYARNIKEGGDDFLTACRMVGDTKIVKYDEIYVKENLMPGVVESLKYMLKTGKVDMIVACSHYTGPREAIAKNRLFREELPFVVMLPESLLKFHTDPAQMGKRRDRSSKNNQINLMNEIIARLFGYDVNEIESMLVDDSKPNLDGLSDEKLGILYRPRTKLEIETGIDNPTDSRFIRQPDWSMRETEYLLDRIEKLENSKEKTYRK